MYWRVALVAALLATPRTVAVNGSEIVLEQEGMRYALTYGGAEAHTRRTARFIYLFATGTKDEVQV
jgi:hypothetical protein